MKHKEYYTARYYDWQEKIGEFGGWANLDKFSNYISKDMVVVDFGSGGGFLLKHIKCKEKLGIEINDVARENAKKMNIKSVKSTKEIQNNYADLIVSNHALEHTTQPINELRSLYKILKPGGKIIFLVPCESINYKYKPNDINYHLFSWSPMCIGNLFNEAGFKVIESKAYKHKWPPKYEKIAKFFGRKIFNLTCKIYARIATSWLQVRIVAVKEG